MILPSLIRALLEENTVAISGLGTFFVKSVPSQIKEDIIYPPHNIVEFEFSKDVEGFSFVSKLSQWEQMRIDEAQAKISEWADIIEKGLEHNKSVFFDDFGTFLKDTHGKIIFQGMIIAQLNIESEGLEPVIITPKNYKKEHQGSKEPVKDKRVILHHKKKKNDGFLFWLIIIAAAVLICALFLKDQMNNTYQTVSTNIKTFIKPESIEDKQVVFISKIAEEEQNSSEFAVAENVTTHPPLPDMVTNETKISTSLAACKELYLPYQKGNYYIIAGSFAKEESALLHIKQKKLEKFHAKLIVHPENPRIRVCIGVFNNEGEALKTAEQLDKKYWILK